MNLTATDIIDRASFRSHPHKEGSKGRVRTHDVLAYRWYLS